ncbi:unnamed protein product [Diplocarpon coronariae]
MWPSPFTIGRDCKGKGCVPLGNLREGGPESARGRGEAADPASSRSGLAGGSGHVARRSRETRTRHGNHDDEDEDHNNTHDGNNTKHHHDTHPDKPSSSRYRPRGSTSRNQTKPTARKPTARTPPSPYHPMAISPPTGDTSWERPSRRSSGNTPADSPSSILREAFYDLSPALSRKGGSTASIRPRDPAWRLLVPPAASNAPRMAGRQMGYEVPAERPCCPDGPVGRWEGRRRGAGMLGWLWLDGFHPDKIGRAKRVEIDFNYIEWAWVGLDWNDLNGIDLLGFQWVQIQHAIDLERIRCDMPGLDVDSTPNPRPAHSNEPPPNKSHPFVFPNHDDAAARSPTRGPRTRSRTRLTRVRGAGQAPGKGSAGSESES